MELDEFMRFVEGQKHLGGADTDDTDTVEAFVALGGKVRTSSSVSSCNAAYYISLVQVWTVHIRKAAAVQADRSGKVLIEKLRNTIKVGFGPVCQITVWSEILSILSNAAWSAA